MIETERLELRPVSLDDKEDMYEYASDKETAYFVFDQHRSLEMTEEAIIVHFMRDPLGKFGIVLKGTGKLIGTIDLRVKDENHRAILGYVLNKAFQGKGYMTEAGEALLDYAFNVLNLDCVAALHDERNEASGRVMRRLGMQKEGVMRHVGKWKNGEYFNDVYYSILKKEYEQMHKKQ
ncbi:ribosomal-protein-alanine N-acetyltransferase [Alkalibacterium subtropicum]|uniref:Ribosomal-protein-alanine N-acetyltransferase n=1 Tax=Alkalibacterium subtropicum TaxID=753702 RepID=A0A1I1II46_9LACT|nr:GNAT family protein [Alkalibacterium subtropicum]SFC35954.1 ribosomal-protein-alanine N-acetyltransferase [Alkalibacterium subtropicum]